MSAFVDLWPISPLRRSCFSLTTALLFAGAAGCEQGAPGMSDTAIATHREQLLLSKEPADAVPVLAAREEINEGEARKVSLLGHVGGMPNPWPDLEKGFPWRLGEATFFLVDPATVVELGGHEHEGAGCAFCNSRAALMTDSIAAVTFAGPDGKPLAVDAGRLLPIQEKQLVVVTGTARLVGDVMVVEADGISVRD